MSLNKDELYTLRWTAMKINRLSSDKEVDALSLEQIKIISGLLGEPVPEEFLPPEAERPDSSAPVVIPTGDKKVYPLNTKALWYPEALVRSDIKRPAKGTYANGYPIGAVVHFTAGRYEDGQKNSIAAISSSPYFFCSLGTDGKFVQANPLNQWGHHAGNSAWVFNGKKTSGVSNHLVGIEITNPGILTEIKGEYYPWYNVKRDSKGKILSYSNPIPKQKLRISKTNNDNIVAGAYLPYTKEQETTLVEFLLWAKANNPNVFNFDYVLGHDEVSGPKGIGYWRKNDPGHALSMTMTEFRNLLKSEYKKRYG